MKAITPILAALVIALTIHSAGADDPAPGARSGRPGNAGALPPRRVVPVVPETLDAEYTRRMRAVVAEINAIGERVKTGVGSHGSVNSGEAMTTGIFADAKRLESGIDTYAAQIRYVLTLEEWKPPSAVVTRPSSP